MRIGRTIGAVAVAAAAAVALSACTPGIPVAYHVEGGTVDLAFCESFDATEVEVVFSDYPPPFMGPMYTIASWTVSGPAAPFGNGVPVSRSIAKWAVDDVGSVPESWDRVDYSFFDDGELVGGVFLFSRDVQSSDWTWQEGFNINRPTCDIDLD